MPDRLSRDLALEALWADPDLLLAQTCGLPLVSLLAGRVRFVATPSYAAEGCKGGDYRSGLVVRRADDRMCPSREGRRMAATIPNARFVELDSANHVPLEKAPAFDKFFSKTKAFLQLQAPG